MFLAVIMNGCLAPDRHELGGHWVEVAGLAGRFHDRSNSGYFTLLARSSSSLNYKVTLPAWKPP